jgi:hypothetical protein
LAIHPTQADAPADPPPTNASPPAAGPSSPPSSPPTFLSVENVLEIILMLLVGSLFAYMFIDSLSWHPDVARLPRIASSVGIVVLIIYIIRRVRSASRPGPKHAILDLGFDEEGLDRRTILSRTARFLLTTVGLFVGCWLFGFHTAIPVYVFGYLLVWGHVRWYWCLAAAVFFEAYMLVAYDLTIHAQWPEPIFGFFDK